MEEDVRRQLEELDKNKSAWLDEVDSAIINSLTGFIAGLVCMLFQASIDQGEV